MKTETPRAYIQMSTGILTLYIQLPGCHNLKEKRAQIKPILARLHRNFNVSAAEIGLQDKWQEAVLACAVVGNERTYIQQILQKIIEFVQNNWPNIYISDQRIEIL
jgi:uncharacterized protein YlxP (DUF503 family)